MKQLRGMTWNHERGLRPLVEASKVYKEKYNVEITWDARSLSDFELFPLDQLASEYDMLMIDHPHIGIAHAQNLLTPLENELSAEFLKEQKDGTVGQSYMSYFWEGHQYAIPLDAATQVGAYHMDEMKALGKTPPKTWDDVFALAEGLPADKKIAIPFVPVHAYSSFFTMCSHFSEELFWSNGADLSVEVGKKALDILTKVLAVSHEKSVDFDPILMLDAMMNGEEIVYSPLVYGYSNYAREGFGKHVVKFIDMPKVGDLPKGSMIGGVGLCISSQSKEKEEVLRFMNMVSAPSYQKKEFYDNGGQPGHIDAWKDAHVNADSNDFFIGTLDTLTHCSLRPRFSGYIDFQAEAGSRIREFCKNGGGDAEVFVNELNALIRKCRDNGGLSS
ncbi:MAG: ABC transporter substrate-binding protein [Bacillota bacterium]